MMRVQLGCSLHELLRATGILLLIGCMTAGCIQEQPISIAVASITPNATLIITTDSATPATTPTSLLQSRTVTPRSALGLTPTTIPTLSPAATSSLTPQSTWTPLATIAPDARAETYYELMDNNGGCELPCWWGFELGKATANELVQFYERFDPHISIRDREAGKTSIEITFVEAGIENGWQTNHRFVAKNGIITTVDIIVGEHSNYQLESLLQHLGPPSEVWMGSISDYEEDGHVPFMYALHYPEQGIAVDLGHFSAGSGANVEVLLDCFEREDSARLYMWDPTDIDYKRDQYILDNVIGLSETQGKYAKRPLTDVSDWDVDEFYAFLSDPNRTECLETPTEHWPTWP